MYVLYHGPSLIDGEEIVAILTRGSKNHKTGNMDQVWIMRADIAPHHAIHTGADYSICGDCKHRLINGIRTCYVRTHEAPLSVFRAFNRGRYVRFPDLSEIGRDRFIRLGSYGDPAAVPAYIWRDLLRYALGHTGYTHQWGAKDPALRSNCDSMRDLVMASTDNDAESARAVANGWRFFRVRPAGNVTVNNRERLCPASKEAGKLVSCIQCRACSGTSGRGHSNITIPAHGASARRFAA